MFKYKGHSCVSLSKYYICITIIDYLLYFGGRGILISLIHYSLFMGEVVGGIKKFGEHAYVVLERSLGQSNELFHVFFLPERYPALVGLGCILGWAELGN